MKKKYIEIGLDDDMEKIVAALERLGVSPEEAVRQSLADYAKKKAKAAKTKKISHGVGVK